METFHFLIGAHSADPAWWQMCVRAVIIFVYAVALYRLAPTRAFADLSAIDIVLTVILGSSFSRALTGNAPLLPVLAATALLVLMHVLLTAMAARSDFVSRLVKGRPIQLIKDGSIDWAAIRRGQLGERDLAEQVRLRGIRSIDDVGDAFLERNGSISAIGKKS